MRKRMGRAVSWLLSLSLILGIVAPTGALAVREDETPEIPALDGVVNVQDMGEWQDAADLLAAENPFDATGEYEIYPTPHSVTYADPTVSVTLPDTMQVVYGEGIDRYTKARAVEAFEQAGVTLDETATTDVKLQVSIDASLSTKTSAHKVTVDSTGVTVVGVDTDAAFYGLTTMKRILQQVDKTTRSVKCLTVEDYADVPFRGFIEGYYGQPWTVKDRVALMEFGGELKMNIYFYAPKDDPKHNAQWRELYSDEEIETMIKPMAEAGERTKCRFGYALHCFMNSPFRFDTQEHYDEDLAVLEAKYEQGIKAGARQIALLADDAGIPSGTLGSGNHGGDGYVKLLNDLTAWLASSEMQTKYPGLQTTIPFCPQAYDNGDGNYDQLKKLNEAPEGVSIIMTGGAVYKPVDAAFLNAFKSNVGREAYLWVNWPCSDNVRARLMMLGQDKFLRPNVVPGTVEGIMLNPMQQSEPSKVGLFCNADYAWNLWTDEQTAFKVWEDSFKYVEAESAALTAEEKANADALKLLSQHMGYNIDSRPPKTDESQYMWDKMTAFRTAMDSGSLTAEQIEELRVEYQAIYDAAVLYKNKTTGNLRILGKRGVDGAAFYPMQQEQMAPWLDCAEDLTLATLDLLDALSLSLENTDGANDHAILQKYFSAQQNLTASQNHDYWNRSGIGNFTVKPEFGGQRLIPFTDALMAKVAEIAKTIVDPSALVETIITSGTDVNDLSALRDGDDSTKITFKNFGGSTELVNGAYLGVKYNRPIKLTSVNFKLGDTTADNGKNTFGDCKLQYTEDGTTWVDIPGEPTIVNNTMNSNWSGTCRVAEIGIDGLSLDVRGVRVVATEGLTDIWIVAREIYINGKSGGEPEAPAEGEPGLIRPARWTVHGANDNPESNLTDGNDSTYVWYNTGSGNNSPVGDYIGWDLGKVMAVGNVHFVVGGVGTDKWTDYRLEYSSDNTNWTPVQTYSNSATVDKDLGGVEARYVRLVNTVAVSTWVSFSEITVSATEIPRNDFEKITYQSDVVKKLVDPVGILEDDSASLAAEHVILRSGEFVGIALPSIRSIIDIVADYTPAPGLVLKVGMNESEMEVVNLNSRAAYNGLARYVRLENTGSQTISFQLNELSVKSDVIEDIHFVEEMTNMGFDGAYGYQDNRESLNFFDGRMDTVTTLANGQNAGEYVTYDLGQLRSIKKLAMAMSENETNYLRHGVLEVSPTGADGTWTTVLTVNNDGADYSKVKDGANSDPSFKLGVPSQNNVAFVGELDEAVQARYLRIHVTQGGRSTFVAAAEILINTESLDEMEYVSSYSDPTIEANPIEGSADYTPDKMRDGDLTTGFRPNMDGVTSGSLIYRLSDETSIGQINLVQGNTGSVTLSVRPVGETEFEVLATLSDSFSQTSVPETIANVAEIKLTWGDVTPTFYELITISREQVATGGGQAPSEVETIPINSYSGDARKVNFDENWKFNLGDVSGAEAPAFNDAAWRTLNLPHDFSIEQPYSGSGCEAESGWLPGGTGWYRKSFTVSSDWKNNKVVSIDFGGAYMETDVYLNGHKLGENKNGYNPFSFVLPAEYLNDTGENVIAVKVVNSVPSSRWYSGSGIYRSVNLTVTSPVHVARYGTYVNPVKGSGSDWTVNVKTNVQNDTASAANVTVEQAIYKLDGTTYEKTGPAVATGTSNSTSVNANATGEIAQTISVSNPSPWNSWDRGRPDLYVLETTVKQDGTVVDTYETEFGFRTIEFTTDVGFKLNGEPTKLKGVCQHHDQGALGAEAWYRAMERQVEMLMDMGCNSIRVTHNPAADELIEICNRKGILIIDEAFDCWTKSKNGNSNDFARFFYTDIAADNTIVGGEGRVWSQFVLETMVNRDKNAPCVIMYSLGNEILSGAADNDNPSYIQIIKDLVSWKEAIDLSRPVTMGDDSRWTGVSENETTNTASNAKAFVNTYLSKHGVVGFNYCHTRGRDVMGTAHNNDGWVMYGSETASHVNSRGVYNIKGSEALNSDKLLTSYDKSRVSWGDTAAGAWWYTIRFDYNMGEYVWTGFDYIGEPTPANGTSLGAGWNNTAPKSSYFGIIDTNGIPKDNYYLYRSMWNEDGSTTLHVLPTWDEEDLMIDSDGKVEVVAYTNAPVVRVYLNGVEVGAAKANETTTAAGHKYRTYEAAALQNGGTNTFVPGSTAHSGDFTGTALYSTFNVPYAEGTLEVKAFENEAATTPIADTVGRSVVRTTTAPTKLVATADRNTIKNDGKDLSYVTIDVLDSKNEIVNGATPEISVSVTGDGKFMGLDNGVQPDHTPYLSKTRKAGAGRLVAIIQSTKEAGTFTVTATSPGLSPATVTVSTGGATAGTGNDAPVSYELSKTIYVQLNTPPKLPETTTVTLGNGNTDPNKTIHWADYEPDLLAVPGEFSITGTIADYNTTVSVNIVVLDDIAALLNYSTAVQVGQVPILPAGRPAVMADGTVVSAQFKVAWQLPDNSVYNTAGTVVVNGTAEAFGKTYNVTATVRVEDPHYIDGAEATSGITLFENGEKKGLLAENPPLYADHDPTTSATIPRQGTIGYSYDTAQNIYKFALTYQGTPPTGGVTIAVSGNNYELTEENQSWQTVRATRTVSGSTVTYQMDKPFSAESVKLTFTNQVQLAEVVLTTGVAVFPIGSTAVLDDLKVNGVSATEAQLAAKEIITSDLNAVIHPISSHNAAVTFLPETADSKVVIVTESEDHNECAVYTVQMNAVVEYPYENTTAYAPSERAQSTSDPEQGPASFAVDGDPATLWHSNWGENLSSTPDKRYIQLKLTDGDPVSILGLRYTPRPTLANGIVTKYQVWVSTTEPSSDATSKEGFTMVAEGDWAHDTTVKTATFDAVPAKYVRLYGVETKGGANDIPNKFMSCSELRVLYRPDKIDLSEATITVEPDSFAWRGGVGIRPGTGTEGATVTVTLRGETLERGVDYALAYENNIDPGTAYIYARARDDSNYQGAAMTTFTIYKSDSKIRSFVPITVAVQPGIDPTPDLPDTLMATTDDGLTLPMAIEWDVVDPSWYNFPQEKTRTLYGTVVDTDFVDEESPRPSATLKFAYSQSVDSISMVTTAGVIPNLPETVTVQFDDGTSGERTVAKWYLASNKDADPIPALTAADFVAGTTVQLMGNIVGIDRVKASASVRVAGEDDEMTYVPGTTNIALNTNSGSNIFPFALAYESSGDNNPYQAIKGQTTGSTNAGDRWSDWQSGTKHNPVWMGVAFETSTQNVTRNASQVLTLVPHKVNQAKVMFVDEAGTGSGAVTYPKNYKIQYYTGSVNGLTFNTNIHPVAATSAANGGNGRVRYWTDSPLLDEGNWEDVTVIGAQPAVPSTNGQMLTINFEPVDTAIIRVLCSPQDAADKWVGIQALAVYEAVAVPVSYSDFTVTSATLGGEEKLSGFVTDSADPNGKVLEIALPANSDATAGIPKLAVTADRNAAVSVVQAVRVPGLPQVGGAWAQATVTSEDGSKTETYTVKFTREGASTDYAIAFDSAFPADKITLVDAEGNPVNTSAPGADITIQVAEGYQADVRVVITEGDREGERIYPSDNKFQMPAAPVCVYATASPITYHITYELDGGHFTGTPRVTYNVETATFTVNDPTRSGFTFQGWTGDGLTRPTKNLTITKGSIGDRTYTATWKSESEPVNPGNSGSSSGSSSSTVVDENGNKITTTEKSNGDTVVTTVAPDGTQTEVTTAKTGEQSAEIILPEDSFGAVTAAMPELKAGDTVADAPEVKIDNKGENPVSLTIPVEGDGTMVAVRIEDDGTQTIVPMSIVDENGLRIKAQPGEQTIRIIDNKKEFVDVPDTFWGTDAVDFVSSRELFNGVGANQFAPSVTMNRAMMVTVLWRLSETPESGVEETFSDVQSGAYYENAVRWGIESGVVEGNGKGFSPDGKVTREMMAVFLYRMAGSPAVVDELPRRFVDAGSVSSWAQIAMSWAVQNDIIRGRSGGRIAPQDAATRAEAAAMLQRFVEKQV